MPEDDLQVLPVPSPTEAGLASLSGLTQVLDDCARTMAGRRAVEPLLGALAGDPLNPDAAAALVQHLCSPAHAAATAARSRLQQQDWAQPVQPPQQPPQQRQHLGLVGGSGC